MRRWILSLLIVYSFHVPKILDSLYWSFFPCRVVGEWKLALKEDNNLLIVWFLSTMKKSNSRLKSFPAFVLLFLCCVHLCVSDDTSSLIALRKLLLQRNDVISTWFDSRIPPCHWSGIRCEGSLVHKISLACTSSPLSLPFPMILREFRLLKHLNVSHC